MDIIFYKMNGEKNRVDKTSALTSPLTLSGTLRESMSVLNPVITIQYGIFQYNYCYIADFGRYYFIVDDTVISNNIHQLTLKVDVLYSYNATIKAQTAFIARNENNYNTKIVDNRFPLDTSRTVTETKSVGSKNFTPQTASTYSIVLNVKNNKGQFEGLTGLTSLESPSEPLSTVLFTNIPSALNDYHYLLTSTDLFYLNAYLTEHSSEESFVLSCIQFPFAIARKDDGSGTFYTYQVRLGTTDVNIDMSGSTVPLKCYYPDLSNLMCFVYGSFYIAPPYVSDNYWLNFEPYSKYELYIPYKGWIVLDPADVLDCYLELVYYISVEDGSAQYFLINTTNKRLIDGGNCQLGINIPFTTTNSQTIRDERIQAGISASLSGISGISGALTGNPYMLAGSANSIISSIGSLATQHLVASCQIPSGETGQFAPQYVYIRTTYPVSQEDYAKFRNIYGAPLNETVDSLSSLTGYTEVGSVHLEGFECTSTEQDEIESLLKSGVIL